MTPFNSLFSKRYATSQDAIEQCQRLACNEGFSVRIRTSKSNSVYLVCSREGKPRLKSNSIKHNRNLLRCQCGWRVVLFFNYSTSSFNKWEFKAGSNMIHNHHLGPQKVFGTVLQRINEPSVQLPPIGFTIQPSMNVGLPSLRNIFPDLHLKSTNFQDSTSESTNHQSSCSSLQNSPTLNNEYHFKFSRILIR